MSQLQLAKHRIFGKSGLGASNISIAPGTSRDVTSEAIATELNRAISQIEAGDFESVTDFDD